MAIVDVQTPQFSESVSEGTLLTWKKKPGEAVAIDETLVEIETDKVVLEVPAPAAGVLAEILKADGSTVVRPGTACQDRHRRQGRRRRARHDRVRRRPGCGCGCRSCCCSRSRRQQGRRGHAGRRQDPGREGAWPPLTSPAPARTAA